MSKHIGTVQSAGSWAMVVLAMWRGWNDEIDKAILDLMFALIFHLWSESAKKSAEHR